MISSVVALLYFEITLYLTFLNIFFFFFLSKVEGPFGVMLYDQRISYFVLRADPKPPKPTPKRSDVDGM